MDKSKNNKSSLLTNSAVRMSNMKFPFAIVAQGCLLSLLTLSKVLTKGAEEARTGQMRNCKTWSLWSTELQEYLFPWGWAGTLTVTIHFSLAHVT